MAPPAGSSPSSPRLPSPFRSKTGDGSKTATNHLICGFRPSVGVSDGSNSVAAGVTSIVGGSGVCRMILIVTLGCCCVAPARLCSVSSSSSRKRRCDAAHPLCGTARKSLDFYMALRRRFCRRDRSLLSARNCFGLAMLRLLSSSAQQHTLQSRRSMLRAIVHPFQHRLQYGQDAPTVYLQFCCSANA